MSQCPPQASKQDSSKRKDVPTDDSSASPRPRLKTAKSTGWSWPRLVTVSEQRENSTGASSSRQRSRNSSAAASLRGSHSRKSDMPDVKEDVQAEAAAAADVSPASEKSATSSARTMTRPKQVSGEAGTNGVDTASSISNVSSLASASQTGDIQATHDDSEKAVPGERHMSRKANVVSSSDQTDAISQDVTSPLQSSVTDKSDNQANTPKKPQPSRRISISFEDHMPVPPPKITVQHPSEASENHYALTKVTSARSADRSSLERRASHQKLRDTARQDIANDLAHMSPRPTQLQSNGIAKTLRPKKSTVALRKTRNACVRPTFLKMLLGRELAGPAKQALRKRARGEAVTIEDVSNSEVADAVIR